MNNYLSGTTVKLPVLFVDNDGNELQVTEATYRIVDQNGIEIKPTTNFVVSDAEVIVEAKYNQVATLNLAEITLENMDAVQIDHLRVLEFDLINDVGNTTPFSVSYLLSPRERLVEGLNSFQSLNFSKLTALSIPHTETFMTATNETVVAAMVEAKTRICSLNFLDYDLQQILPVDYLKLPEKLKAALKKAQVAEANVILGGGDPVEAAINQGLKSQTIGETHESYIGSKQISTTVNKATLRYLGGYISSSKKIARA